LVDEQKRTGLTDAAVCGTGMIRARRVAIAITDSAFIMGSMGSVVGERLTRLIERATEHSLPLIIVSGSGGGARMHEGILSLMQMAKVSAALAKYHSNGGLYISVLTNPTMGGVAASFASLGDLIFAEPKALIGFAGPRTIKATIRIELPEGFQTSEFLLDHGYIDRIVQRKRLKTEIATAIDYCGKV
jgi:acetyl-CoA carboxylase carboxyl transferase subunit beta